MTSVKHFKHENQRSTLYKKRETRNTYDPHQQTTTTEQGPELEHYCLFSASDFWIIGNNLTIQCFQKGISPRTIIILDNVYKKLICFKTDILIRVFIEFTKPNIFV